MYSQAERLSFLLYNSCCYSYNSCRDSVRE